MTSFQKSALFLIGIIIMGLLLSPYLQYIEGFSCIRPPSSGEFPASITYPLLTEYPLTDSAHTSAAGYGDMWKKYPIYSLGSYDQVTNNWQQFQNPDNGTCSPADFCGTLYADKPAVSHATKILPPVQDGLGTRVGYFISN